MQLYFLPKILVYMQLYFIKNTCIYSLINFIIYRLYTVYSYKCNCTLYHIYSYRCTYTLCHTHIQYMQLYTLSLCSRIFALIDFIINIMYTHIYAMIYFIIYYRIYALIYFIKYILNTKYIQISYPFHLLLLPIYYLHLVDLARVCICTAITYFLVEYHITMSKNIIQCFYFWLVLVGTATLSYISKLCKANLVCIILTILKQTPEKRQTFMRFLGIRATVYSLQM